MKKLLQQVTRLKHFIRVKQASQVAKRKGKLLATAAIIPRSVPIVVPRPRINKDNQRAIDYARG